MLGYCGAEDQDPRHCGTLLHRLWTCPVLEAKRQEMVPGWIRRAVRGALRADGTMAPGDLLLYTRGLVRSPEAVVDPAPAAETFQWVVRPRESEDAFIGKFYIDGSMLDAGR